MENFDIKLLKREYYFEERFDQIKLGFWAGLGLFSPKKIDDGSRMLLKELKIAPNDRVLDLGCGYGVLGLVAAKMAPQGQVDLIDKDFVAVEYTKKNIAANHISNAQAYLSNLFDQIPPEKQFDVIMSNLPAKVNKEMYWLLFYEALNHLEPGGQLYIVAIANLRKFIKRSLKTLFGDCKQLKLNRNYVVIRATRQN